MFRLRKFHGFSFFPLLSNFRYVERVWAGDDLFDGGPVCFCSPGSMHNFHLLRKPHYLMHVAGTDLATEWTGFMSGAVQSGYRAAAEVILEIKGKVRMQC
jgi:monoamine oxidase